jgi:hypothetical protein
MSVGITAAPTTQGLMNEEGMVEVDTGSFSIEPFLYVDGTLLTWADAQVTQELEHGYLPIPSSCWRSNGMTLRTTAFATGEAKNAVLFVRYRVENTCDTPRQVRLFAALRPFQVTPPWQAHQGLGGASAIKSLACVNGTIWVNNRKRIVPLTRPDGFGAVAFDQGAIMAYLKAGNLPPHMQVSDDFGYASGALCYAFDMAPHTVSSTFRGPCHQPVPCRDHHED